MSKETENRLKTELDKLDELAAVVLTVQKWELLKTGVLPCKINGSYQRRGPYRIK